MIIKEKLRQKRLVWSVLLLKLNSRIFFFYFAAIAELSASLPRIIFHSPTPNFEKFPLIFTSKALCSVHRWGRLRTWPRSHAVILAPDHWSPKTRKRPTFQRKCRMTKLWTHKKTKKNEGSDNQTNSQTDGYF